jgi:hypothetical protein
LVIISLAVRQSNDSSPSSGSDIFSSSEDSVGGSSNNGTSASLSGPTVIRRDLAADPQDENGVRYLRRDVDIRRVSLKRTQGELQLIITAAAPPLPGDLYTFSYWSPDGNAAGKIQAWFYGYKRNMVVNGVLNDEVLPNGSGFAHPLATRVVLDVPFSSLDPTVLSHFYWSASISGKEPQGPDAEDYSPNSARPPGVGGFAYP